jgi:glyoxylase-like metal-dependent hydrolase (beta-lactamase superfamily II)
VFPKAAPERLEYLLDRVPPSSYDRSRKMLCTSVHSWLVRDGKGLVMLIDTCFGNFKNRMPTHPMFHMQSNQWLSKLATLGVRREDVTHVVNTHLHLDHVGWNTWLVDGSWEPTFSRARHIMPRLEAELLRSGRMMRHEANDRAMADSVLPVIDAGLADFADPYMAIAPDMQLILGAVNLATPQRISRAVISSSSALAVGTRPSLPRVKIGSTKIFRGFDKM